MSRERDDAGRYTESVSGAEILRVFATVEGPIVTSGDVADRLGCSRETARRRLEDLEESGPLASRRTAGRVVWWRTEDGSQTSEQDVEASTIDPDDEFWTLEPGSSGEQSVSERVDDVLYDEA
jgi:hypothetical protein